MDAWILGPVFVVLSLLFALMGGSYEMGKTNFVKDHSTEPYCIERSFGSETVKRCYVAKEEKTPQ